MAPTRQLPNQSPIYPLSAQVLKCNFDFKNQFNYIPANFNRRPYSWSSFPLSFLVSDLCNLTLN